MLRCSECQKEYTVDQCIILKGRPLCVICAVQYMIDRLEYANRVLMEIVRRLEEVDRHERTA